jgi:glycosyltransferase involved in cell wall biosynthesis
MEIPKVYVITATIGSIFLEKCIQSIQKQDYSNIEHIIICDGKEYREKVIDIVNKYENVSFIALPWNTGRNKVLCHKIYAAIPHLIQEPSYISFLEEENYVEKNHISSMMKTIRDNNYKWSYSLRNIVDESDSFICKDYCESLGSVSMTWLSAFQMGDYILDTSSYLVPVEIIREFSYCLQHSISGYPDADRLFYSELSNKYKNFGSSMKYTLNHRIHSIKNSVKRDFFIIGNERMNSKTTI